MICITFLNEQYNIQGIHIPVNDQITGMLTFLRLFLLLYADDTVIMSNNELELQNALDAYEIYCDNWKLTVNISKSKIVIFSKGRQRFCNFRFKDEQLEIVQEYKYLGVYFCKSGSFKKSKEHIAAQASRAMYSLLRNCNRLNLPIDIQIDLFTKTIKPILLYGAEIWGFGNLDVIERVQLKFLKHIFKMKRSTPNYIVYGESGCMPLTIDVQEKIISFWSRLITRNPDGRSEKLSAIIYRSMFFLANGLNTDEFKKKFPWLNQVRTILIKCGLINLWNDRVDVNLTWLKLSVRQKLKDMFLSDWYSFLDNSNKSMCYRVFKKTFGFENYLKSTPSYLLTYMIRFRTRNHRLPIETGNWQKIPVNQRLCHHCSNKIGDEFHYLFECSFFDNERKLFLKPYFFKRPNMYKFEQLMTTSNKTEYIKLCKFIKCILST